MSRYNKKVEQVNRRFQKLRKRWPELERDYIEFIGDNYGYSYCEHCEEIVFDIDEDSGDCEECQEGYAEMMSRWDDYNARGNG